MSVPRVRSRRWLWALAGWIGLLLVGVVLLAGRYDWSPAARFYSRRAYFFSAYFFLISIPTLHGLGRALGIGRNYCAGITGIAWMICVVPYHWLGMDRWPQFSRSFVHFRYNALGQAPGQTNWLPGALLRWNDFPFELAWLLVGIFPLAVCVYRWARSPEGANIGAARSIYRRFDTPGGWCALCYALILIQTWMHLSMRSPYTYVGHFTQPRYDAPISAPFRWFHDYMYTDGSGAVHADYRVFRACEKLFQATPTLIETEIIRRVFFFFVSAQFTYWINPFIVSLALNVCLWLACAMSGYALGRALFSEMTGRFAAILTASGTGFIYFVAQPMSYLAGYAAVLLLIWLFHLILVQTKPTWPRIVLFGTLLFCGLSTTDLQPLLPMFILLAILFGVRLIDISASIGVAVILYAIYCVCLPHFIQGDNFPSNHRILTEAFHTLWERIVTHQWQTLFTQNMVGFERFGVNLARAFFYLPVALAIVGLALLRSRRNLLFILILILPALGTCLFFALGSAYFLLWEMSDLRRLQYIAYPAVYLLAATALAAPWDRAERLTPSAQSLVKGLAGLMLLAILVLNNIDAFGFPRLYFDFSYGSASGTMPTYIDH